ncbi:single-strand DNA endonuclease ASTE1-like [Centroberyx affinis]|uniref:single-strand DNA endonuclease ASTE1-like n=1 Tax=Centroberyx affinis TaxID=166261 RepID=UPI003A5BAA34
MGVQGLCSLIEANSQIYQDVCFRDSRLVIDGPNVCTWLYFGSGLDQNHGGEYAAFEDLIGKFVKALKDCRIEPYVVLGGGTDITVKKLDTNGRRAKDRFRRAQAAALGGRGSIKPPLAKKVFKQTLARLEVPVAQCFGEADREIAALASEWKCPVLSNDSDFYIFDLPAGLLPTPHFHWKAGGRNGSWRESFIRCKSYTTSRFCTLFNIQTQILPVFAALAGNDYVKLQELTSCWARSAPAGSGSAGRLEELLRWLRDFQRPREAVEAALRLMGDLSRQREAGVVQGLSRGTEEYQLPPSYLKRFFTDGTAPPLLPEAVGLVPDWARLPLTQGRLTRDILAVLLLKRVRLGPMVDHGSLPSAYLTSQPLRQVMYGLLLGGGRSVRVEESDREGLRLGSCMVRPAVRGVAQQLKLLSMDKAAHSLRLQVFLEALGVKPTRLSGLPPHLHLPVAVTCYWMREASPPPDRSLLQALMLGLVTGETQRESAGSSALWSMKTHCSQKPDLGVVHAYNQWQACMKDSIHLNQLLGCPLPEPHIARLYQGPLVHQLVDRLRRATKPELLLSGNSTSIQLYRDLLATVLQPQETTASSAAGKRGKHPQQPQPLDDLTGSLQRLFLLDEDKEEEEESTAGARSAAIAEEDPGWQLVSMRTRFRAKDRGHREKNPEGASKKEDKEWS